MEAVVAWFEYQRIFIERPTKIKKQSKPETTGHEAVPPTATLPTLHTQFVLYWTDWGNIQYHTDTHHPKPQPTQTFILCRDNTTVMHGKREISWYLVYVKNFRIWSELWWLYLCNLYCVCWLGGKFLNCSQNISLAGARGGVVGWGTAQQAGRSRVRLPMVSLEFFIAITLPAALRPRGWLSL